MKLLTPAIFEPFPEVIAAMSLRDQSADESLSMAAPAEQTDSPEIKQNRRDFAKELGFPPKRLALLKQIHSDTVIKVEETFKGRSRNIEGDALICNQPGWLLGVTVADCVPLLLYDPGAGAYAAIHSGWRGSAKNIASLAIDMMVSELEAQPPRMYAWIGPSAGADSYEVGYEVVSQFNPTYSQPLSQDSWLLDNKSIVRDQLLGAGLSEERIEISTLDTITNQELHSDRRDGDDSSRMLASIGLSNNR